jgi:uncharacterized protein YecE (DUF72 family)
MTDFFVGTSGWAYNWNLGNSLDWYVKESGQNAIELNMSYYRFPFPNMVNSWAKKGKSLAWIIKVHRSITHFGKLNKDTYPVFDRFKKLFSPLEEKIHYYLFQLPPKFTNIDTVEKFIEECGNEKIAVEFRNVSMFNDEIIKWGKKQKILLVSVDAPKLPTTIMSEKIIYERIHGKIIWYSYNYSKDELQDIKERIMSSNPKKVYVFFNNNHAMLENGRAMFNLLKPISEERNK